jgi:sterol desaturase/sphingolipid hydroxylase (fatty acid hydroxylase superfamily)
VQPVHQTPFRERPEPREVAGPVASTVRALQLGAVLAAGVVAFLLGARTLFGWRPPFDAGWLVLPAFLLPALVTGVRLLLARARERD